jgi:hypothetical protein
VATTAKLPPPEVPTALAEHAFPYRPHGFTIIPGGHSMNKSLWRGTQETA